MGDRIKDLRKGGQLHPTTLKALESLWGYSNEEAGRHGKSTAPNVDMAQATFMMNVAAAALLLLLELDLPLGAQVVRVE